MTTENAPPPVDELPDRRDASASLAYLLKMLEAVEEKARPIEAMRPQFVGVAANISETSPEWAELWQWLKEAKVALNTWKKAVRALAAARAKEESEEQVAEAEATADRPGSSVGSRIAALTFKLQRTEAGKPKVNVANLAAIFATDPRWEGKLGYHVLREAAVKTVAIDWPKDLAPAKVELGDWTDQDSVRAVGWLNRYFEMDASPLAVAEVIEVVARRTLIDPVRDYLTSVRWDGIFRLDTWLSKYMGAEQTEYTKAIGIRWMISAVARGLVPGCKVDCVLTLEGLQGKGKSSAGRALVPDQSLFFDDDLEIGKKDAAQSLRGKWIVELGELGALSRAEIAVIKAFISRQVDSYRGSFMRRSADYPRRGVFFATVNDHQYLTDIENRRFWPVRTNGEIDFVGIARDRDLLWAEAVARFEAGELWHVDTPELAALCSGEQEQRAKADPWEAWIFDWLRAQTDSLDCQSAFSSDRCTCFKCSGVTTALIMTGALQMRKDTAHSGADQRIGAILRRIGWVHGKMCRQNGMRVRPYYPSQGHAIEADKRIIDGRMAAAGIAAEVERSGA